LLLIRLRHRCGGLLLKVVVQVWIPTFTFTRY